MVVIACAHEKQFAPLLKERKMPDLPEEVQRSVATYAWEGSRPVRKGGKLFGSERRIAEDCVCGLCVAAEGRASSCTLINAAGARMLSNRDATAPE